MVAHPDGRAERPITTHSLIQNEDDSLKQWCRFGIRKLLPNLAPGFIFLLITLFYFKFVARFGSEFSFYPVSRFTVASPGPFETGIIERKMLWLNGMRSNGSYHLQLFEE